ncbi:phage tail protein [Sphingomonas sp. CBMAI 2297]|uniref:phage tail protein n=1 Tax=Sphingomonas sp. CBMAI 2297 TaxID=2991720 RepID=UPI0024560354|nr:phage tail protein [Sphingomonas sp. CBMAI 2297]MDH4743157.1 phage tail protein [Sphingomonas sp. CBMAI 2297]
MNKPDQLRRVLLAHVPDLKASPDRLSLFIDKGRVVASAGSLGFVCAYTLNVVVQDYAGDVPALLVPVLAWIAEAQPDLLQKPERQPFTFGAELMDEKAADVSIYIDLTETVQVQVNPEGGFSTVALPEPVMADEFAGVCCVLLRQLKLGADIVAESETPPGA